MFFNSFFALCLWGPFADENKQLPILSVDNAKSAHAKTQAQSRAAKRLKKMDERANDTTEIRGFTTDQRVSMESISINRKRLEHRQKETLLVALIIKESVIRTQIEAVERRAEHRCLV